MADHALRLGPYMSISSKNVICTRTEKAGNAGKSQQTNHHTDVCLVMVVAVKGIKERLTELARAVSNTSSPAGMPSGSVLSLKGKSGLCWQHARQNYMPGS